MTDLEFIKEFSKITVIKACKDTRVDKSNLYSNRTSDKNVSKVARYLQSACYKLLENYYDKSEDSSL